jgi:dTDP-4-dehydrorhamnose reductase
VTNIIIIGANGMIGNCLFKYLSFKKKYQVYGFVRNKMILNHENRLIDKTKIIEVQILGNNNFKKIIQALNPEVIINCAGIVKQNPLINNIPLTIELNSLFPHNLNLICKELNCRLIQLSTDCVFSGKKGNYKENDYADANDLYGRSKFMGEINDKNCLTIRTSFIGHELKNKWGLLSWFISQEKKVNGFKNSIYSGLTTLEIAKIIYKFVLPNKEINGLYHIASNPIDKFSLLEIINEIYQKDITIKKDYSLINDKSLDFSKFREVTGYEPIEWAYALKELKNFQKTNYE